jgi:hypothetical protein
MAAGAAGRLSVLVRRSVAALKSTPAWILAIFGVGMAIRIAMTVAYRPAFLGFPDSQGYVEAASDGLFDNRLRTGGYALFLRAAHLVSDELTLTIAVQHLLGVLTALLLYAALRVVAAPAWTAALPAAVVLLGGIQLYLEHAPLSEPLFGFLVGAGLYCAARTLAGSSPLRWLALAGLLLGIANVVRPAGLFVAPALAVWAVFAAGPATRRVAVPAAVIALAALPLAVYVLAQRDQTGFTGITRSEGWTLYGRVAEFADCDRFEPPAGTAQLCEDTSPSTRRAAADYLFDPAVSPALQTYGSLSNEDDAVGSFARAAILGDPVGYARVVGRDLVRHVAPAAWTRQGMGFQTATLVPYIHDREQEERAIRAVAGYWEDDAVSRVGLSMFDAYAHFARVEGPLTALLAVLAAYGLIVLRGPDRRAAALFALAAAALMLLPVATLSYDVRYATPAYGPLAAAAALGLAALAARLRAGERLLGGRAG